MAWMRPSRSRPGQGRRESLDSGGAASCWRAGLPRSGMGLEAEAGKGANRADVVHPFSSATIQASFLRHSSS